MNRLTKERIFKQNTIKGVWGIIVGLMAFMTFMFLPDIIETNPNNVDKIIFRAFLFNLPFLIVYFAIPKHKKIKFTKNDKDIFIIALNFLKYLEHTEKKILSELSFVFSSHKKEDIFKLYKYHTKNETSIYRSCKNIVVQKPEIKYYTIYSLLDIASKDQLYTIIEEEFIEEVRKLIRIHINTFQYIKNAYLKKGLQDERKIMEEQNRRKLAESFLPYNAYKILGVAPTITKEQLKKVYRTLAKKYHPDKHQGQTEEIIQKAEDKFQEILQAYEIIKKHKKF